MEDIDLLEAIGIASMFTGGGDDILTAPVNQVLDPTGYYQSQGLDPFGRPLQGASPNLAGPKPTGVVDKGLSKLNAFRKGYETGIKPVVDAQTKAITGLLPQGPLPEKGGHLLKGTRFAGDAIRSKAGQAVLKYAPAVGTALSVGDVILGDESIGNKAMDAGLMAAGGAIGSVIPVVGTGLGITGGKMVSDGLQWLFGDKKSPEQRKMELALAGLGG